jgi:hypothetical protein
MTGTDAICAKFDAFVQQHPEFGERIDALIDVMNNASGDMIDANVVEEFLIEEFRKLGGETMQTWAEERVKATDVEAASNRHLRRAGKKKVSWHTRIGDHFEVVATEYRDGNRRVCPFLESANIEQRGCSIPLQRLIVDLAADMTYAEARKKLREHHGQDICESSFNRLTQKHAQNVLEIDRPDTEFPQYVSPYKVVIAMTDGGMVPVVVAATTGDKRKGKKLLWREAKIALAHARGSVTPFYAGCIEGGVDQAGKGLLHCAVRAGFGANSHVHSVGDGAPWIVGQMDVRFGAQGSFIVDFYHLCEYLAAAVNSITSDAAARKAWMDARKAELLTGRVDSVLATLSSCLEPEGTPKDKSPVRTCHNYMVERTGQFDYAGALKAGLPIGSGEIESAHRYVVQKRLKMPGAWWTVENAERMIALRILRLNGDWESYWENYRTAPPAPANSNDETPKAELKNVA